MRKLTWAALASSVECSDRRVHSGGPSLPGVQLHQTGSRLSDKGSRYALRPVSGKVPRLRACPCSAEASSSFSPFAQVFPDRATLELQRLQARLGAQHSFREAARIMQAFLSYAKSYNTTVRNRLGRIAEDITEPDSPENAAFNSCPGTTIIDGAHIRCKPEYQKRHLSLGQDLPQQHDLPKRFALCSDARRANNEGPANRS